MVPKVIKEEGQTPPPAQIPRPGSPPPPPPVLRSNASLVRGSACDCSAVVVWSGVVTVGPGAVGLRGGGGGGFDPPP